MAHFAQIDENNIVVQVIVADQSVINFGFFGDPSSWIQTSYNTCAGGHVAGGTPLRKNFAGVGYTYDQVRDAFIPPKEHDYFILNETSCTWEPPTPAPNDGKEYKWHHETLSWKEIE
jgi:hypothetical protein